MADLIAAARRIVTHLGEKLEADLTVELWNGERMALIPGAREDIVLMVRSPVAFGRLLRAPSLMTLFELFVAGHLDFTGGSPLEALDRWEHMRAVKLHEMVDRKLLLRAALPFLTVTDRTPAGLGFAKGVRPRGGGARRQGAGAVPL